MDELKRLQAEAARLEAIVWLSKLASAIAMGIAAVFNGVLALFTGCFGFFGILLMSAPLLFFCLLFVLVAALIH